MTDRKVTEMDFRMPEYRDARVEDYEFRCDGKLVRKDRWECAVNSIRHLVGLDSFEFEIVDVIDAVRKMAIVNEGWVEIARGKADLPNDGARVDLRLSHGSVLKGAVRNNSAPYWVWNGMSIPIDVVAWRESQEEAPIDATKEVL